MSQNDAHETLLKLFGPNINEDNLKLIPFQAGNLQRPWDENVVNIGLSSGFIEPLESTGIYFIEEALDLLTSIFPLSSQAWARNKFNKEMRDRYQECADFVFLHYLLSDRDDSEFWNDIKDPTNTPERLKDLVEFWRGTPPSGNHFTNGRQIFGLPAHEFILYGMNFLPNGYLKSQIEGHHPNPKESVNRKPGIQLQQQINLLSHDDFLDVTFGAKSPDEVLCKYQKSSAYQKPRF